MSLKVTPEHLPVIGAQLDVAHSSVLQTLLAGAPVTVATPPGLDVVSAQILPATFAHAAAFFPSAFQMIGCGEAASAVLPVIAADYAITDMFGGACVDAQSTFPA
ncbi:PE domain-containing protein [Nocardia sp. NPDC050630]|uniref:PE domain-containing protein n=1 Tax=Nocardia sp. NPDC050630 TaxID=3364321 RepID=UPI00379EDEDF